MAELAKHAGAEGDLYHAFRQITVDRFADLVLLCGSEEAASRRFGIGRDWPAVSGGSSLHRVLPEIL